jgi:xanthine dehydrogenase YagS FAD-binding subunit
MRAFEYYKVTTVAQALSLLSRHGEKAAILAGGSDLLSMMKDRVEGPKLKSPQYLLDINGIKGLNEIREQKTGIRIGATATLTDIASSPLVARAFPLLIQAAGQIAVPQIRNVGTLGGNLCQKPRCWYFRGKLFKDCLRKGGDNCYAAAGENQYHAIFGGGDCNKVCSSDMAFALTALNARIEIASPKGTRLVPLDQFYAGPEKNILKETLLGSAEIVTGVDIPAPAATSKNIYLKLKERQAFDFAVSSLAAVITLKNNIVVDARLVLGGVAPFPLRATRAEAALKGKKIGDAIVRACEAAVEGAHPLSNNGYKVKAIKGLVESALVSLV